MSVDVASPPAAKKGKVQVQPTMTGVFLGVPSQARVNEWTVGLIVRQMLPFSLVESDAFQQFSRGLQPSREPMSRWQLMKAMGEMYVQKKQALIGLLKGVPHVATTCDGWSSRHR